MKTRFFRTKSKLETGNDDCSAKQQQPPLKIKMIIIIVTLITMLIAMILTKDHHHDINQDPNNDFLNFFHIWLLMILTKVIILFMHFQF